jgi:putative endonuclease
MERTYYVYIVTNPGNTVLYTGVTSRLLERVQQHRDKLVPGFTSKYNCTKLVYYEIFEDIEEAIVREKQIKGWLRKKKITLIESINPGWLDVSGTL